MKRIRRIFREFRKSDLMMVVTLTVLVLVLSGILFIIFEDGINTIFEALYFSVVTISTVGYGDITPKSAEGRIIVMGLIFFGMIFISIFTAIISSILIAKKIKDGQGMGRIKFKKHVILCGWNWSVEGIIKILTETASSEIVLINDLEAQQLNSIIEKYPDANIQFIKGDFADINVLERANVISAQGVIIVPDISLASSQGADEKTVFATMTIKSISEKIKVYTQLNRTETIPYIERAKVDDYFISSQTVPYFLSTNIVSPGLNNVIWELLSYEKENVLKLTDIPKEYIGKPFKELSTFYKEKKNSIVIALVQYQDILKMKNIDSTDTSSIDAFIKRKFEEAGRMVNDLEKRRISINPKEDYVIKEFEHAVLIQNN
ncbi:MAG: hypothetical protein GQ534_07465 [Candidatus Delongbacteria bacterium]|nr:hypothetical protein [Candidatus Delongbacteria bacterium]